MGNDRVLDAGHVLLGKYRIEGKVGEGGMAIIYRATSLGAAGFERPVVIKVIKPQLVTTPGMTEQFVSEASVGAALHHPNIVSVFDLGEDNGLLYMVLEYVRGKDLSALIQRARGENRVLGPEMIAFICAEVTKALECAHGHVDENATPQPIIHRDVSPQNILLSREGMVKLADFGMARALGTSRQTTEGMIKGKLSYMSPEQSTGADVDGRSDLFSLGVVMWEALTGRRLFLEPKPIDTIRRVRACQVPPLAEVAPHVQPALADIVYRLLAPRADDRIPTATQAGREMRDYLRSARRVDPAALTDLIETYYPTHEAKAGEETADSALSFSDEGEEGSLSIEALHETPLPAKAETGADERHTLLMFGAQAEALADAFERAKANAQERRQRSVDDSAVRAVLEEVERPDETSEITEPDEIDPAGASGSPDGQESADAPPVPAAETRMATPPTMVLPRPEGAPAAPVQSPPPAAPPAPSGNQLALWLSLLIGIPLGAAVGFFVFWLLTH